MKNALLKAHTEIEAAEENYHQLEISRKVLKAEYMNEIGYEFDKQRRCSLGWGLVLGAFICSTIYRKGSTPRKAALFLTMGHLFNQSSYYMNLDKYIDCVLPIFEDDVAEFEKEERDEERKIQNSR